MRAAPAPRVRHEELDMSASIESEAVPAAQRKPCVYPTAETLVSAQRQFDHLARTALKPCERFICRDRNFEDLRQEGLGRAWEWYSRQVASGHTPDTALVVHATRLAMINRDHSLVGHEHRPRRDVYDRQGIDVELRRLDGYEYSDDDDDSRREQDRDVGRARLGVRDPSYNILSAMDLESWLGELAHDDREMVELRGAGFGLEEIGKATGHSVAGVFRRTRQLGSELAERAGLDVVAKKRCGRTADAKCVIGER